MANKIVMSPLRVITTIGPIFVDLSRESDRTTVPPIATCESASFEGFTFKFPASVIEIWESQIHVRSGNDLYVVERSTLKGIRNVSGPRIWPIRPK